MKVYCAASASMLFSRRSVNVINLFSLDNKLILRHFVSTMVEIQEKFTGQVDRYNGITVDSKTEPCDSSKFPGLLKASLDQWIEDKRRTIWFRVDLSQTYWVPTLTSNGFKFHHAKQDQVMLYRWLPENEDCNVPPYAHTNLGAGAVVINKKTREILVVKEKHGLSTSHWKLPGGYVEPGEDISTAVEREVLEETGVKANFQAMILFRHGHGYGFGCSDIYTVSCLVPETFEIAKNKREIDDCQWMKIDEYVSHPNVHKNNRLIAEKVIKYLEDGIGITRTTDIHPLSKKPIDIYSVESVEGKPKKGA